MIPDISQAKDLARKTPYFPAMFQGRCTIDSVRELNGFKGHAFVVEFIIKTSNLPDVTVGSRYSWYVKMGTPELVEYALPNLKQFTLAAVGAKTKEAAEKVTPNLNALTNAACTDKQPMKGTDIFVMTNYNEARTFTKHTFSAV